MSDDASHWLGQGGGRYYTRPDGVLCDYSVAADMLGVCYCGYPESALLHMRDLLLRFVVSAPPMWGELEDPATAVLVYWMDDRGWLEHGSSISGSWITEKGMIALEAISARLVLESVEAT